MEPLKYLDFELKFERKGDGFLARILRSPAGEASGTFRLPFSEEKLELLVLKVGRLRRSTRRVHSPEMEAARELGGKLFEAVFSSELRACLKSSIDETSRQPATGLRLKLRLQDTPELADLPWEFLFDPAFDRFLAQSNYTPIVRYLELPERIQPLNVVLPLRILVMISSPADYTCLDVAREKANMQKAMEPLTSQAKVKVNWLEEEATLRTLQHRLREEEYHIFHFIGHGGFDTKADEGVLVLKDERGNGRLIGAHRIGTVLHDSRSLRLAVLNSCEGARNTRTDPFAGMASTLVRQGIPAVVAMQFEITDEAAIIFSSELYAALSDGFPVDAALAEARKAIYLAPNDVEWGTPVLYMRSPDGVLFNLAQSTAPERPRIDQSTGARLAPPAETKPEAPLLESRVAESEKEEIVETAVEARDRFSASREPSAKVEPGLSPTPASQEETGKRAQTQGVKTALLGGIAVLAMIVGVVWISSGPELQRTPDSSSTNVMTQTAKGPAPSSTTAAMQGPAKSIEESPSANTTAVPQTARIPGPSSTSKATSEPAKRIEGSPSGAGLLSPQVYYSSGQAFYLGRGVEKDEAKAAEWYGKAAAQGHVIAQYDLGTMYRKGQGVPKDEAKAAEWYGKAAAQGSAAAQNELGTMYASGQGVPQDDAKAVEWYEKAAAQGYSAAQNNLGNMYAKGRGVPQDDAKAVEWYKKAAAQGLAAAQNNLGIMYASGRGVPQDATHSAEWYRKAAAQGDATAQNELKKRGLDW